jgi:hypothetical protein
MAVDANPDLTIDLAIDEMPPRCAENDTFEARLLGMLEVTKAVIRGLESFKPTTAFASHIPFSS